MTSQQRRSSQPKQAASSRKASRGGPCALRKLELRSLPSSEHQIMGRANQSIAKSLDNLAFTKSAPLDYDPDLEGPLHSNSSPQPDIPDDQLILFSTMFLQRSAVAVARRAAVAPAVRRTFATTVIRRELRHRLPVASSNGGPNTWRRVKTD